MNNNNITQTRHLMRKITEKDFDEDFEEMVWIPKSPCSECIVEQDWKDDYEPVPLFLSNQASVELLQERITEFVNKKD